MNGEQVEALMSEHRAALLRFCAGYLDDAAAADDAVQDVFARALVASEPPRDPRLWLFTVARNHCLNLLRSRSRRKDAARLPTGFDAIATAAGAVTRAIRGEERQRLIAALEAIPDEEREALRLRYSDVLSRAEIAAITQVDESVVKTRLFDGLARLRKILPPESP